MCWIVCEVVLLVCWVVCVGWVFGLLGWGWCGCVGLGGVLLFGGVFGVLVVVCFVGGGVCEIVLCVCGGGGCGVCVWGVVVLELGGLLLVLVVGFVGCVVGFGYLCCLYVLCSL